MVARTLVEAASMLVGSDEGSAIVEAVMDALRRDGWRTGNSSTYRDALEARKVIEPRDDLRLTFIITLYEYARGVKITSIFMADGDFLRWSGGEVWKKVDRRLQENVLRYDFLLDEQPNWVAKEVVKAAKDFVKAADKVLAGIPEGPTITGLRELPQPKSQGWSTNPNSRRTTEYVVEGMGLGPDDESAVISWLRRNEKDLLPTSGRNGYEWGAYGEWKRNVVVFHKDSWRVLAESGYSGG